MSLFFNYIRLEYGLSIALFCYLITSCTSPDKAAIDAAAQQMFEDNYAELQLDADENCIEKRAVFLQALQDSIKKNDSTIIAPSWDE